MIKADSNLAKVSNAIYHQMMLNYDYFGVIMGDEGKGKSRGILLNMIDYWYNHFLNKQPPTHSLAVDLPGFVRNLEVGERMDLRALDEAGDAMDAQDYANKMNRAIYKAYTVIREKKFFSLVVLPSIFDLNPRFRKRRVRLLINVYKRVNNICKDCKTEFVGKACSKCQSINFERGYICWEAWNRKKLQAILIKNETRDIKSVHVGITPTASGIINEYDGQLVEFYDRIKTKKTQDAVLDLKREINESDGTAIKICRHDWRFKKRTTSWTCLRCGFETDKNPFGDNLDK